MPELVLWSPCPWEPDAITAIVEGLELEVHFSRLSSFGHMWIVYGYRPHQRYPDILDSGFSRTVQVAQNKATNAARKLAAPPHIRERRERRLAIDRAKAARMRELRRQERLRVEEQGQSA